MRSKHFENFHTPLFWVMLALVTIGIANLYSALHLWGEEGYLKLFWTQLLWLGIGFFFLLIFMLLDYRIWDRLAVGCYIFLCGILAVTLFVGEEIAGHRSWLKIGPIGFQPSELAKLGLILILAKRFGESPGPYGLGLREVATPILLTAIPFGLVLASGDLGSSIFFPLLFFSMAWLAKMRIKTFLAIILPALFGAIFAYHFFLSPYQKERFHSFINPTADVRGSGYHLMQSKIAIGSGGLLGKGYLKGKINKLRYLPEKHTDFIYSVLAEEWGFFGSILTVSLFGSLLLMALKIAEMARERFGSFLAFGITALLFWQVTINLGGVLGLIPLTGVTLPFLSYGGSATITILAAMGLLFNIYMRRFLF